MSFRIVDFLVPHFSVSSERINSDPEFQAAASTSLASNQTNAVTFGIASSKYHENGKDWVLVTIESNPDGSTRCKLGPGEKNSATFSLQARPEDWQAFFAPDARLKRPYQSFWGMLRVLSPLHNEVHILGDVGAFAKYARVWRIVLDRIRDAVNSKPSALNNGGLSLPEEEVDENAAPITGTYLWITHSECGRVKVFYEYAGTGEQIILFLHTAGSDSRQYHSLMETSSLQQKYTMYSFDLPAHGRSSIGTKQIPESYALTESAYLESISLVIKALNLTKNDNLILCGASMAGHICLAAAIHARSMGVRGVISCEGCAHLPLSQPIYEMKGNDSAILDPERVCGMIAPSSPEYYRRQIWWQYSSQGTGIFAGDLKFYFKGWDGRSRMKEIDTKYCPVHMLTGEYDYSCTVEASRETAEMIEGAVFEEMKGLGHFPLTENPVRVLGYLVRAIEGIQARRGG